MPLLYSAKQPAQQAIHAGLSLALLSSSHCAHGYQVGLLLYQALRLVFVLSIMHWTVSGNQLAQFACMKCWSYNVRCSLLKCNVLEQWCVWCPSCMGWTMLQMHVRLDWVPSKQDRVLWIEVFWPLLPSSIRMACLRLAHRWRH